MIGATDIRFIDGANRSRIPRDLATFVKLEYGETNAEWFLADGHAVGRAPETARRKHESRRNGRSIATLALVFLLRFRRRGDAGPDHASVAESAAEGPSDSTAGE